MKKILFSFALILAAAVAYGDLLYWQVDPDSNGVQSGQAYANFAYATIKVSSDNGKTSTYLKNYVAPDSTPAVAINKDAVTATGVYADLSGYYPSTTPEYSYVIELLDESGNILANSGWANLSQVEGTYISKSNFNNQWTAMTTALPGGSPNGWLPGAAVPEPTSGLLMLLGAAMLGLRRRKIA